MYTEEKQKLPLNNAEKHMSMDPQRTISLKTSTKVQIDGPRTKSKLLHTKKKQSMMTWNHNKKNPEN